MEIACHSSSARLEWVRASAMILPVKDRWYSSMVVEARAVEPMMA